MAEINIQEKVLNSGGTYDNLYPKTTAANTTYSHTTSGLAATTTQGAIDELASEKSNKSTIVSKTLSATSWTGSSAPYTYTLTVTGVTTTSVQELLPSISITSTQLTALQAANIIDGGQSVNIITLHAFGVKPIIDIPIRVILRGDM